MEAATENERRPTVDRPYLVAESFYERSFPVGAKFRQVPMNRGV